jgi:hypothetical protein
VVGVPVRDGVDEVALALTADPLGRTYRTTVVTVADAPPPVRTRHGPTILADGTTGSRAVDRVQTPDAEPPAGAWSARLARSTRRTAPPRVISYVSSLSIRARADRGCPVTRARLHLAGAGHTTRRQCRSHRA